MSLTDVDNPDYEYEIKQIKRDLIRLFCDPCDLYYLHERAPLMFVMHRGLFSKERFTNVTCRLLFGLWLALFSLRMHLSSSEARLNVRPTCMRGTMTSLETSGACYM